MTALIIKTAELARAAAPLEDVVVAVLLLLLTDPVADPDLVVVALSVWLTNVPLVVDGGKPVPMLTVPTL